MRVDEFEFDLPEERIAQQPRPRGGSRMLVVEPSDGHPRLSDEQFSSFPSLLHEGDVVVLNDTRVFPARLYAEPREGMQRHIEILLTRPVAPLLWEAWCRPARRLRAGDRLRFSASLEAVVESREGAVARLVFEPAGESDRNREELFWQEVERIGSTPLPPYIRREEPLKSDAEAYQTVYARARGAVAAPTAGLHFTEAILDEVRARGVEIATVTLHVGPGTFRPVTVDDVEDHRMDSEWYEIGPAAAGVIESARRRGGRIVAIGTTSVRTLESAALRSGGEIREGSEETSLFITPGFEFRVVDAMLTNFHLPGSTLMMLVSAFAGMETIRAAYRHAIAGEYFFYSFGDCMFLSRRGSF